MKRSDKSVSRGATRQELLKAMEETLHKLQRSEERYQAFIHNSNEGIWRVEIDKPISIKLPPAQQIELMYKYAYLAEANDTMAKMYGLSSGKDLRGLRLSQLLVKEDPANTAYLMAFIESGYSLSGVESHEIDRAGQDKYFRNSLVGTVKNGNLMLAWGTQQDVTDQHKAAEALIEKRELEAKASLLAKQHAELLALNKLKDEFISLASHQLRTPLTGVKQYVGMLLEGYVGEITDEQRQMLIKANRYNERQLKIIDDLLTVASVDSGRIRLKKSKTDFRQLLQDIIAEHTTMFQKRDQQLILQLGTKPIQCSIDAAYIRMALENIVNNASKYSPEHTKIEIKLTNSKNTVNVIIKDSGVGIAKRDQTKLFQKFSRIDNPRSTLVGGSGLGLYIAKRMVDLHDGTIEVTSRPGTGTTFTISLPKL